MKYAIETNSLTKAYGDFLAVDDLYMKVKNKSIFGFLGPNGAGKTTTIKMLTCLIKPTKGTAKVGGYDINTEPNEVRQKIGMVPQLVSLYRDLTAKENVELCADYYGLTESEKEERIPDLMELVDIKYAENKLVKQMSGGQQQKVSVVASLIHRPDILFLDEPTIGLDPTTKMVLWDLISELNDQGHTIVLCSHDMYEVELLCENVGIMNLGELVAFNTPQGLKDNLMNQNEHTLLKKMEELSSVEEFPKYDSSKEPMKSYAIEKARFLKKDPDNHNPRYLEEVRKHTKEVSILVKNMDEEILKDIKNLNVVYHVNSNESGDGTRLTIAVDKFAENSVNNVIWTILENNGQITSINTKDPSLEDVFVDVTGKKVNKDNIKI
jgi:ABC-2 type transport system ATP-binding protein